MRHALLWLWIAGAAAQTPAPTGSVAEQAASVEQAAAGVDQAAAAGPDADRDPGFPPGLDPIIAIDPLNPRLDPAQPWAITAEGRVIPQRRLSRPPTPILRAPLTDAFSVRTTGLRIELTRRGQTALGGALGLRVDRLEIDPVVVRLTAGESFALDDLAVRAYGPSGEFVERAPLRLEIEAPDGFVDLQAFERDRRSLTTLAGGVGRIWVTSLLPASGDEPYSIAVVLDVRGADSRGARMSSRMYEDEDAPPR